MDRQGHNNAVMFLGTEVEHTPAYGMKTLFVVGLVDEKEVLQEALRHDVEHIYLGANQSFQVGNGGMEHWSHLISACLAEDYWVTLDYDVNEHHDVMSIGVQDYNRFISMISVKLPGIRKLNYNATLKIDDSDYEATNPGVWCHSVHNLQKRNLFTDWSKYTQDQVIKEEVK
jgi:hypothetical protein